ncbi:MAG: Ig-like domain-containing protein, partial [Planctomyces sp.]
TPGALATIDTQTFTVSVTPTDDGPVSVSLTGDTAAVLVTPRTATVTYDTVRPQLTIAPNNGIMMAQSVLFTFRFSEPVTGFTVDDVVLTNGTALGFAATSAFQYTLQVRPVSDGIVGVAVANGVATDAAGNLSLSRSATMTMPLHAPTAVAPPPLTPEVRPLMSWTSIVGAVTYEVSVSNVSTGVTGFHAAVVSGTNYTPPVDSGIERYRLSVRAVNGSGQRSAWSSARTFQINRNPSLISLARNQNTARPTISWNALLGAVSYDVRIDNRTTRQVQYIRDQSVEGTGWTPTSNLPMGTCRIWVRGVDGGGIVSTWSQFSEFVVIPAPVAAAPVQPAFQRRPAFVWNVVRGAVSYEVSVMNLTTRATVINQTNIRATTWTPAGNLADGNYRWWVRGRSANNVCTFWSIPVDFSTGGRTSILSPTGTTSDTTPTFTSIPVTDAARYELWVTHVASNTRVINQTQLTATSFTAANPLAAGVYRIWVRAVSPGGELSVWSAVVEFTVS